jgi:hypothetical protein
MQLQIHCAYTESVDSASVSGCIIYDLIRKEIKGRYNVLSSGKRNESRGLCSVMQDLDFFRFIGYNF